MTKTLGYRLALLAGGTILAAGALTACGGSHHAAAPVPAGLSGQQTGVAKGSAEAAEEASASQSLTPEPGSFLHGKTTTTVLGSTTPDNGDENPYAIWPVTRTVGKLHAGDVLVDNFNNSTNEQGTGTTIVDHQRSGGLTVFADIPSGLAGCPGGVGLTTAMVQLDTGWVIVGSLPSTNGLIGTVGRGCLVVVSPEGKVAGTITGPYLDGPWDAAVIDQGDKATLFVTNTLIGVTRHSSDSRVVHRGDVVRLSLRSTPASFPKVTAETTIASGFGERPDASAFVKGPTGLAVTPAGTLYVGDNLGNRITKIPQAATRTSTDGTGSVLSAGGELSNPLGLALAPNGDILAANATNGKIVEVTPAGRQVGEVYVDDSIGQDPPGNGDLFDVAVNQARTGILYVDDGKNTLDLLH